MSHIVEAKTKITYPNLSEFLALSRQGKKEALAQLPVMALLRQAVTLVAKEHAGTVESFYLDYRRRPHEVNTGLALHIPQRPNTPMTEALVRGIGLQIDETTGHLTFIGDPYEVEDFYETMQRQIVKNYAALAYMASMRLEQYQQVALRAAQENLIVSGEIYGEN